jgi:hypothetical protein
VIIPRVDQMELEANIPIDDACCGQTYFVLEPRCYNLQGAWGPVDDFRNVCASESVFLSSSHFLLQGENANRMRGGERVRRHTARLHPVL